MYVRGFGLRPLSLGRKRPQRFIPGTHRAADSRESFAVSSTLNAGRIACPGRLVRDSAVVMG